MFIERLKRDGDQLNTLANKNIPRVMFFMVPVFAMMLGVAYRNRRWRLPAHLVVALLAWIVGYGLATLRGIYGGRWRTTVARGIVLGMGYSVAALIGFAALMLVLLVSFAL